MTASARPRVYFNIMLERRSQEHAEMGATETQQPAGHRGMQVRVLDMVGTSGRKVVGQPQNPTGPNPCAPRFRAYLDITQEGWS